MYLVLEVKFVIAWSLKGLKTVLSTGECRRGTIVTLSLKLLLFSSQLCKLATTPNTRIPKLAVGDMSILEH